jgi:hypothetical protein
MTAVLIDLFRFHNEIPGASIVEVPFSFQTMFSRQRTFHRAQLVKMHSFAERIRAFAVCRIGNLEPEKFGAQQS